MRLTNSSTAAEEYTIERVIGIAKRNWQKNEQNKEKERIEKRNALSKKLGGSKGVYFSKNRKSAI